MGARSASDVILVIPRTPEKISLLFHLFTFGSHFKRAAKKKLT